MRLVAGWMETCLGHGDVIYLRDCRVGSNWQASDQGSYQEGLEVHIMAGIELEEEEPSSSENCSLAAVCVSWVGSGPGGGIVFWANRQ